MISLTPAALDKMQGVREAIASVNSDAVAGLEPDQRETFLATLRSIIAALDAIPDEE
ncbi:MULTISPECIES: hypothetical protein [unclassified Xanthobacter]|uniref:hypothetical protein n=1 Tax=unclassified Xanthobacter TaxID=2623496 RepID=UPI001F2A5D18|nr:MULTISPECIES: hypothetical protein [unclassified Xanthobacter]